jgi:signal peptidase II
MMRNKYFLATVLIVILDHVTKLMVRSRLGYDRVLEIIPGYLRFSYLNNTGVAFGFFDKVESVWKPYILGAMAVIALGIILYYSSRMPPDRKLLQLALAVVMGGIAGNFLDRIIRGYVIDFIEFHIRDKFYWPSFNIADSAITVGIALLLIDALIHPANDDVAGRDAAAHNAHE